MIIHMFFARKIWSRIALIALLFSIMLTETSCVASEKGKKDIRIEVQEILNKDITKGNYKKAAKNLEKLLKKINIEDNQDTKDSMIVECNLALCYILMGDYEEAENYLEDAKQKGNEIHLEEYPIDSVYYTYGQLEVMRNNHEEAVAHFKESLKWRKSIYGEESDETGSLYIELAFSYLQLHKLEEAEKNAQMALRPNDNKQYGCMVQTNAYIALGDIRMEQKNYEDAVLMYKEAEACYSDGGRPLGDNMLRMIQMKRVDAVDEKVGQRGY